ncbi:MAG TPA: hypothetical protein VFA00_08790 [Actinomycetota bacterium]|jgi:hypothetical protein|nr:hypothetical protein [Actinomycetota bacterium]
MAKYLVLYRSKVSAAEQMEGASPDQAQAGMDAWMKWAEKVGNSMVDMGSPLQTVATVGGSTDGGYIGGFSVLEADSADAAKALVDDHPHLVGPGDPSIEVLEFLALPGMS